MIGGRPAADYNFQPAPVNVSFKMAFEESEARVFAGLSPIEYETLPGTRDWLTPDNPISKCDILIQYRMHHRVINAPQDAQNRELARKMKRGKYGR